MKRITIIALAIAALALVCQISSEAATNEISSVKDLGMTEGKPITNGFVFIDGKYIDTPYDVTRRGHGIFINGYLVEQPCPWPIPEKPKPAIPTKDLKMPVSITKNTSQYDKDLIKYLGNKQAYYRSNLGEKEMVKMMVQVYQELPCVLKASAGRDEEHISVTWADGSTMEHRLILPKRKITDWTRENILERTEKDRANYENRLNKGDYYFLGTAHGRMTGTADGARMVLENLLPILKTSKDAKEVQQRMTQAGFPFFDEKASEAFFTHKTESKELEVRVEKLKRVIGDASQQTTNQTAVGCPQISGSGKTNDLGTSGNIGKP